MTAFTIFHVLLSLVAIVTGVIVAYDMVVAKFPPKTAHVYMFTTIATLLTGFLLPITQFTPAIGVGILCTLIFIPTALALHRFHLKNIWRKIYVVGSLTLFYFNSFVLIVQLFQKVPVLHELAPVGNEPPFLISQTILLLFFLILGFFSVRRFEAAVVQEHA